MFGVIKTLEEDLKKEISGNFLKGVLALLQTTEEYEAQCIREAIKVGNNIPDKLWFKIILKIKRVLVLTVKL